MVEKRKIKPCIEEPENLEDNVIYAYFSFQARGATAHEDVRNFGIKAYFVSSEEFKRIMNSDNEIFYGKEANVGIPYSGNRAVTKTIEDDVNNLLANNNGELDLTLLEYQYGKVVEKIKNALYAIGDQDEIDDLDEDSETSNYAELAVKGCLAHLKLKAKQLDGLKPIKRGYYEHDWF